MQFIQFNEIETLLKNYRHLKGLIQTLRLEIKRVWGIPEDDFIETAMFKKTQPDDIKIFSKGQTSDKTGNIAVSYKRQMEIETNQLLRKLKSELLLISTVVGKIEIAYKTLPEEMQQIIKLRYYENFVSGQIEQKLHLSKYQLNERRKQALKQMRITSRITMDDYNEGIKILKI